MFKFNSQVVLASFCKRYLSLPKIISPVLFSDQEPDDMSLDISFENIHKKIKLLIDVRSPAEYMTDHLFGAINIPILNNDERSDVGKIYDKGNSIAARLFGSSLIMKNLSTYLQPGGILYNSIQEHITNENDQIIVYCWRGGQRSKSVAIVLSEIGFTKQRVRVLNGGYRAYRKEVMKDLETLPNEITFLGICGLTGSAKTKILKCLQNVGETVLNLEELAEHKGSVFGPYIHNVEINQDVKVNQPSQKAFDSRLWTSLKNVCAIPNIRRCKDNKPIVWVECESRNIGSIHLPQSLWNKMQNSKRIIVETNMKERINHILTEYAYWTDKHYLFATTSMLSWLSGHNDKQLVDRWIRLANDGQFEVLVESLLVNHYDPIYRKNRAPFISCTDTNLVSKLFIESLDTIFIQRNICPKLIDLSNS